MMAQAVSADINAAEELTESLKAFIEEGDYIPEQIFTVKRKRLTKAFRLVEGLLI
jgi:hypothetical protein